MNSVVVVGAGPAGLAAASLLGQCGVETVVFDEYPVPGGRLVGQQYRLPGSREWFIGRRVADGLLQELAGWRSVELRMGASVVGARALAEGGVELSVRAEGRLISVVASACLVATGAAELPLPIPGWTLPGVITAGAAQTLSGTWGIKPGRLGVMVGLTPLALAISQELEAAGVRLAGVVMPPESPGTEHLGSLSTQWARLAEWSRSAPAWARAGAWLLTQPGFQRRVIPRLPRRGLVIADVRVRPSVAALRILGRKAVEAIRLCRVNGLGEPVGQPWDEAVDFVCLAAGLRPLPDVLMGAAVPMFQEPRLGGWVPVLDRDGRTGVRGLYAAGSTTGVEGAQVALAQGRLAAAAMVDDLGGQLPPAISREGLRSEEDHARRAAPLQFQAGVEEARRALRSRWEA